MTSLAFLKQIAAKTPRDPYSCVHMHRPARWPKVSVVTFYNPRKLNAFTVHMMLDLAGVMDKLTSPTADDNQPEAVLFTGFGNNFCAGFDVSNVHMQSSDAGRHMSTVMQDSLDRMFNSRNFVSVAALDGFALGGGSELATATDFRVVSDRVHLQFVHRQMGVVPGWGGMYRLVQLVGRTRALKIATAMPRIGSGDGVQMGLFDHVHTVNGSDNQMLKPLPSNADEIRQIIEQNTSPLVEAAAHFLEPYLGHKLEQSSSATHRAPAGITSIRDIKGSLIIATDDNNSFDDRARKTMELFGQTFGTEKNVAAIKAHLSKHKPTDGSAKL